jgi:1-deoxy-D-xylulose-5-phosphate reductoisomerase
VTVGVAVLGATGSIGTSTLRVLERQRARYRVVALTAHQSGDAVRALAAGWGTPYCATVAVEGPACLVAAATHPDAEIVVNAVVGAAGLEATLAALRAGKRVALANKESLVMAGDLVLRAAVDGGGEIVPIDSEHSAVLQCITGHPESLSRLILTASGGPFREWPAERVPTATVAEALRHPTWRMGRKITVDSATLANKALEVIEAHFLFGLPYDAIEVVVHPQSIVHGFVEFVDGSILAQVGHPTMELPILYALTHPERVPDGGVRRFDAVAQGGLTFEAVRRDAFPTYGLGVAAGQAGGTAPAAFNAANEVAVAAFLDDRIAFGRIPELIACALDAHAHGSADSLEAVLAADRAARDRVTRALA